MKGFRTNRGTLTTAIPAVLLLLSIASGALTQTALRTSKPSGFGADPAGGQATTAEAAIPIERHVVVKSPSWSALGVPSWGWATWAALSLVFFVGVTALLDCLCRVFFARFLINPEKRQAPRLDRKKAIAFFVINSLQIGTTLFLATMAFHRGHSHLEARSIGGVGGVLRLLGELFLILLFQDTNFYWFHRLAHFNPKIYETLHADHHVSRYPNAWVLQYQNPVDYFFTTAAPVFWVVLLPIPFSTTAYFTAIAVANFLNIAGHLGYEVSNTIIGLPTFNGWAGYLDPSRKWIAKAFNNVSHHDLHHQSRVKNYSLYFTFWDRIGGTLHPDTDHVPGSS